MNKKIQLMLIGAIVYSAIMIASQKDVSQQYDREVKEEVIDGIDGYVDEKKRTYQKYAQEGGMFPFGFGKGTAFEEAKEQAERLSSNLERAAKHIKDTASSDPVFWAKIQNPDNMSYGQSPFMREVYTALSMPYEGKEGNANMYERLEIMHLLQSMSENARNKEKNLAFKLKVDPSTIHQPGIKVQPKEEISWLKTQWETVKSWFTGSSSDSDGTKSFASVPMAQPQTQSGRFSRYLPKAIIPSQNTMQRAKTISTETYQSSGIQPLPSASKALEQAERFGIGYQ